MQQASDSHDSQRRSAYRQRVAIVPRVAAIVYSGHARRPVRLGVIEVSGSGLQVRSQDELRAGDLLELVLPLDGEVQVHARVRRIQRHEHVWDAGCAFEGVTERLADRIVQFVFAEQRAALRASRGKR